MPWSKSPCLLPLALALGITLAAGGCKQGNAPTAANTGGEKAAMAPADSPWQHEVDAFIDGWFKLNPAQAAINDTPARRTGRRRTDKLMFSFP